MIIGSTNVLTPKSYVKQLRDISIVAAQAGAVTTSDVRIGGML